MPSTTNAAAQAAVGIARPLWICGIRCGILYDPIYQFLGDRIFASAEENREISL
jgi:hypothetical protein